MAGLSITRRRKAWLKGVACGATGQGKCRLVVEKLVDIFQRGVTHGRAHVDTPYTKAIVEQEHRQREPRRSPQQSMRRGNLRNGGHIGGVGQRMPKRRPTY